MLDGRGDGRHGQWVVRAEIVGHDVLVAYAELGLAGAHESVGAILGRLDDLDVEALVGVEALGDGHVDAGVVGVGRVVEHERELGGVTRGGGGGSGSVGDVLAATSGEAGKGDGGGGDPGARHELAAGDGGLGHY